MDDFDVVTGDPPPLKSLKPAAPPPRGEPMAPRPADAAQAVRSAVVPSDASEQSRG
jgi:hypothetical protein